MTRYRLALAVAAIAALAVPASAQVNGLPNLTLPPQSLLGNGLSIAGNVNSIPFSAIIGGTFTATTPGTVPPSGGGTTNFLRADGTWAAPAGGGGGSGNVNGPGSSTVGHFAFWNNTTGTLLSDGGAPAASATTDTTNANNISSGTLGSARLPAFGSADVSCASAGGACTIAANAVTNAKLATATQNTVKGAATSTAEADLAVPSCSTATSALTWTTNTGFGCNSISGSGSPGGASLTVQYNNAGAFGGMSGTSWDDTNRSLTQTGATITASHPILDLTQTWNNAAVAFTGLRANFTVTASNNAGLFLDIQRGGSSVSSLSEFGGWIAAQYQQANNVALMDSTGVRVAGNAGNGFEFTPTGSNAVVDGNISRIAAGVIAVGNGTAGDHTGFQQWGGQARVTSDFTVTSSTALTAVTGLAVALQGSPRKYSFEADLSWTDAAAGGIQAAMTATGGLTATNIIYDGWIIDSGSNGIKGNAQATALGTAVANSTTTGTAGHLTISGTIEVNVAGTLNVAIAQNTSNGTATTVKRGSRLLVYDMP